MKLKPLFTSILFLIVVALGKTQVGFHFIGNAGLGFNTPITLNGDKLKSAYSTIFDMNATYQFKFFKKSYAEVGLGGRYIFSSGKLGELPFKAHTLKMQMPVNLLYQLSKKWGLATGLILRNTKEVLDSDFREKFFWRLGLTGEGRYTWKSKWYLTCGISYELRNIPTGYFLNDPKMALLIGLRRKL